MAVLPADGRYEVLNHAKTTVEEEEEVCEESQLQTMALNCC